MKVPYREGNTKEIQLPRKIIRRLEQDCTEGTAPDSKDKTLLVLLEEEKIKFGYLETEYHKLLAEVQSLQTTHKKEIDQIDKRSSNESRSLQKALMLKSEECSATHDTLKNQVERYLKDSSSTKHENDDLRMQIGLSKKNFKDIDEKYRLQERMISDFVNFKKDVETKIQSRDYELRSARKELEEMQKSLINEKENRKKEEHLSKAFEKKFTEKDEEILSLKTKLMRVQAEKEKLDSIKNSLLDTRLDAEQLKRKEKQYLDELEQSVIKERRLLSEIDAHQVVIRKIGGELERIKIKERTTRDDNEFLKISVQKYKVDVAESYTKYATAEEEISLLNKEVKKYVSKVTILQTESHEVKTSVNKQLNSITDLEETNTRLRDSEALFKRDRDVLVKQNQEKKDEVNEKENALELLRNNYEKIQTKLNSEINSNLDSRNKIRDQLLFSQSKIQELQMSLDQSTKQCEDIRKNEYNLKNTVHELTTENKEFYDQNKEFSNSNVILLSKVSKQRDSYDSNLTQRDEELRTLYQKLDLIKSTLESENNQLKIQINQKHSKSIVFIEEIAHQKQTIAELSSHCDKLETRIADLINSKVNTNAQLQSTQSHLAQKEQDCNLLKVKLDATREHISRLEEELDRHNKVSARKDVDMSRLQSNVTDLSKRLKNQVDIILEKDLEFNVSGVSSNGRYTPAKHGTMTQEHRPILGFDAYLT